MTEERTEASFYQAVYAMVRTIPPGHVSTYGDVAAALGHPRRARQVGWALAALRADPDGTDVPWQRVINAQGRISHRGDLWRAEEQVLRLEAEGLRFDDTGRLDLAATRWRFEFALP